MISAPYWSMTLATAIWVAEGCKVFWGSALLRGNRHRRNQRNQEKGKVTRVVIMSLTLKGGWGSAESLCIRAKARRSQLPDPGVPFFIFFYCESKSHQHPALRQRKNYAVPKF